MNNQDKNQELSEAGQMANKDSSEPEFDGNLPRGEDREAVVDDSVVIAKSKVILAKKLLSNIKENNDQLIKLFNFLTGDKSESQIAISQLMDEQFAQAKPRLDLSVEDNIIEGVFDGENMIGPDGKQYSISANYASKSKLVEGDTLKLTITSNGTFIYKQIGPIDRARIVGQLVRPTENEYLVQADGKSWRVLSASVTYFKGEVGDEVIILVPKQAESKWAAIENIIKKQ